jgi:hypothetical protein
MTRNGIGAVLAALVMLGCSNPGDGGAGGSGGHPIGGGPAGGGSGHPAGGSAPTTTTVVYTEAVNRDLDLVFVVDNSSSMSKAQANLRTNLPAFFQAMQAFPGGMPNLHLAVVSSDMGAGTGTGGCAGNGQAGLFQWGAPGAGCPATTNGVKFLSNVNGSANYTGDLASVFSCVASLGETGCGYEQTLLSVTHALGADNFDSSGKPQPPQENQGFLREGADLAIIMLTNEDDCSAPGGAANDIYPRQGDGSSLSSQLGPPTGYRCSSVGHLCGTPPAPPPIQSPMGAADPGNETTVVKLDSCVSNDDGRLIPVSAFSQVIKSLKPDPGNQILVAAISGLYPDNSQNAPYAVTWKTSPSQDPAGPWPEMVHSCVSAGDGSFADPGVRVGEFVKAFGRNGVLQSICDSSFTPAMQRFAEEIGRLMGPPCVTGRLAKAGSGYDCTVTDKIDGQNHTVPACSSGGSTLPCWHLDTSADCRAEAGSVSLRLAVDREGTGPSPTTTTITCKLCQPGEVSARCPG